MEIELCAVSGYEEVTKNMTAVRIDNEVVNIFKQIGEVTIKEDLDDIA